MYQHLTRKALHTQLHRPLSNLYDRDKERRSKDGVSLELN